VSEVSERVDRSRPPEQTASQSLRKRVLVGERFRIDCSFVKIWQGMWDAPTMHSWCGVTMSASEHSLGTTVDISHYIFAANGTSRRDFSFLDLVGWRDKKFRQGWST
jgi:hypothetical protein